MSSLIKTNFEFPRGDDLQKQGQRLAQDLSVSMKGIKSELEKLTSSSTTLISGIDGVSASYSFNIALSNLGAFFCSYSTYTINHSLGSVPSGFLVNDFVWSASGTHGFVANISRTAWTSTDITIKIAYGWDSAVTLSGSFNIIVLR